MTASHRLLCSGGLALALTAFGGCASPEDNDILARFAETTSALQTSSPIRIAYGPDALHYGDLRLPSSADGPHPVAVVIHGGCWLNLPGLDLTLMDAMSDRLTDKGVATWNIEYRRIGDPGGGYPNTLTDIGLAVDKLRDLAPLYNLDLDNVVTVGHSAGGHLSVWVAARETLPQAHPLRGPDPLPVSAAVSLAGILNLAEYLDSNICGEFVDELMGGRPEEVPERYALASPSERLPLGVRQILVNGTDDPIVPLEHAEDYRKAARRAQDRQVFLTKLHGGDHFDVITPSSPKWPTVEREILHELD